MIFTSLAFLIFFPIVVWVYFTLRPEWRWAWLLAASVYFYMVFIPVYILVLIFLILVDYTAGRLIESAVGRRRRPWLVTSVIANIGTLAIFKYASFLSANVSAILGPFGMHLPWTVPSLILPIGLSFHTFQSLSYTFEVYYGRQQAERHLGLYALYVMFFPQLVAGPIERPQHVLPQLHRTQVFDAARVTEGLKLMLWGFFQKLVIADPLATFVDPIYAAPAQAHPQNLLAATVCFAIQIYCDFSAYSDIAVGAAQVMGISLMRNFDRPYWATSVTEFWRRWHISLSSWFRDYVYIPLGGSRVALPRQLVNLLIVFALSGLWHGARWSFVIWGLLHGSYVCAETVWRRWRPPTPDVRESVWSVGWARIRTILLVTFAWIFFRANSTHDAFVIVHRLAIFLRHPASWTWHGDLGLNLFPFFERMVAVIAVAALVLVQSQQGWISWRRWVAAQSTVGRWAIYYAGVAVILLFGKIDVAKEFIYFQF